MTRFSLFPIQASTIATEVDGLFFFLVAMSLFFSTLIAGLIVVFMVRYRRRPGGDHAPDVHGSLALEAGWTIVPLALTMVIFVWSASLFATIRRAPDDAIDIHVVGKQWMWKAQHMEGRREINELHVPVGRPVKLTMTSEDVIHSFYVPEFRVKQDAVPGRYSTLWFEASRPGVYHLFCAEYCGTLHSGMIGRVVAMEPAAFEAWLSGREAGQADVPVEVAGEAIFRAQGCGTCHRANGTGQGPTLHGIFGKPVTLATGETIVADDAYLRESILTPAARMVRGFEPVMPTFKGLLSEEDVMRLVAYVKSLQPGEGGS